MADDYQYTSESASIPNDNDEKRLPEDLPPVEPPSAGFIIQLFVIPGLIVAAIVGVWALFGKLSSSDQDWRVLVAELRSTNEHRRWRGALGLAQILKTDQQQGEAGNQLAHNREVARELAGLLGEQMQKPSPSDDDLKQQAFLARTLGMLEVPGVVLPTLEEAMQPDQDPELRKSAIAAVALIAGRAADRGRPLDNPPLVDALIEISAEPDPLIRQLSAFTLGLFPEQDARDRLTVLLGDADQNTRLNAAVGLARQDSTAGLEVFKEAFTDSLVPVDPATVEGDSLDQRRATASARDFERFIMLKNVLKAIGDLSSELPDSDREEFIALVEPVAEKHYEPRIRIDAREALRQLNNAN